MQQNNEERLPDWAYSPEEIVCRDQYVLSDKSLKNGYCTGHIAAYVVLVDGIDTDKVVIMLVDNVDEGKRVLNRAMSDSNITFDVQCNGLGDNIKLEAIYVILRGNKYKPTNNIVCSDMIYVWEDWMCNLVR